MRSRKRKNRFIAAGIFSPFRGYILFHPTVISDIPGDQCNGKPRPHPRPPLPILGEGSLEIHWHAGCVRSQRVAGRGIRIFIPNPQSPIPNRQSQISKSQGITIEHFLYIVGITPIGGADKLTRQPGMMPIRIPRGSSFFSIEAKEVTLATLWALILWIIIGALAGWIAGSIMGTAQRQGLGGDIVVGIIGAIIGGLLLRLFGVHVHGFFWSLVTATFGAVILLYIVNAFRRQVPTTPTQPRG